MKRLFKEKKNIILIAIILLILLIIIATIIILSTKNKKQPINKMSSNIKKSNEITNEIKNNTNNIIENSTEEVIENAVEIENIIEENTESATKTTTSKISIAPTNTENKETTTSSTPVTSNQPTQSTTPTHTPAYPTGRFVYKPNYEVQNQVISRIQTIIDNSPSFQQWGGSINAGYGCQGQRFTFRGINNHDWYTENSDGSGHGLVLPGCTSYVYAEDEYCIMSDGTEAKTGMTYLSIWSAR